MSKLNALERLRTAQGHWTRGAIALGILARRRERAIRSAADAGATPTEIATATELPEHQVRGIVFPDDRPSGFR